ncbi:hypothetical protein [Mucilaginibacter psychrotolerans]|uniref:Uncharacterized protein n=1 Tax=Mucilaginibacter psychrotolerans TaxID=1524096 RepID=A0A4Y8SAR7_9SPHI|nr:hypothetical protein [Mucilaginibacter psychrotolerans]TFF36173.1 hypothetical protein E2R66_16655 [Mucilaginibacter psychrotolerans]
MIKTNLYYKTVFKRKEVAKDVSLIAFLFIVSWPRLLLEVFVRKNFGERYFSLTTVIFLSIVLFFIPIGIDKASHFYSGDSSTISIIFKNITWYLFLAGLLYVSFKRQKEIARETGTFDFAKFSAYDGDIHPMFNNIEIKGKKVTRRQICILVEPAFFLAIGIILALCVQKLGILIIFCSLCYALGYKADYIRGDHFILDTIDEMICNEEMVESFVHGRGPEETRGFEMRGNAGPSSEEFRKQIIDNLTDEEPTSEAR